MQISQWIVSNLRFCYKTCTKLMLLFIYSYYAYNLVNNDQMTLCMYNALETIISFYSFLLNINLMRPKIVKCGFHNQYYSQIYFLNLCLIIFLLHFES
jgi:hypothetical protein